MTKYANAKIYSIRSRSHPELIYIGSTTQTLSRRFAAHQQDFRKNGMSMKISSKYVLEFEDAYIELVFNYPCANREELRQKEGETIRSMDCVNIRIAGRTKSEYVKDNKEHIKQWFAQHYQNNKDKIDQRNNEYKLAHLEEWKQYHKEHNARYHKEHKDEIAARKATLYACACGKMVRIGAKSKHEKTKKHLGVIEQAPIITLQASVSDSSSSYSSSSDT